MKKYSVTIIADAEEDLFKIYNTISTNDSITKAKNLLTKLEKPLKNYPHFPIEVISPLNYKEIHYKPYRIIYQIIDTNIYIHCILDGRRDLLQLLQERLIR